MYDNENIDTSWLCNSCLENYLNAVMLAEAFNRRVRLQLCPQCSRKIELKENEYGYSTC